MHEWLRKSAEEKGDADAVIMGRQLLPILALFLVACSTSEVADVTRPVVSPTVEIPRMVKDKPDEPPSRIVEDSKRVKCKIGEFDLLKVAVSPDDRWDLEIVGKNNRVTLPTPSFDEYQNLGVLTAVQKDGFAISVDWGTRIYHDIRFTFTCAGAGFSLVRIDHDTFDKHFPEDDTKYHHRVKRVVPHLPLEKFILKDFMVD